MKPAGLILAGGLGSRLGAKMPKPLIDLGGTTPLALILQRLEGACDPILIGAQDRDAFDAFGHEIVPDRRTERLGPLAGLEAARYRLCALEDPPERLLCVPGDTPFLPRDLAWRLLDGAGPRARVASFAGRLHPTVALWSLDDLANLADELDRPDGRRSLMALLDRVGFEAVAFPREPGAPDGDPFFNVNTPDDLNRAKRHLRGI